METGTLEMLTPPLPPRKRSSRGNLLRCVASPAYVQQSNTSVNGDRQREEIKVNTMYIS